MASKSVIGVCGLKGGAGKTTTSVHLAAGLSAMGYRVALVDCDPQESATEWAKPGRLPMPVTTLPLKNSRDVGAWSDAIKGMQAEYVVLDAPPHLDAALGAVIGMSDLALIPCGPSGLDLIATATTVNLVREIRQARGSRKPRICLLPNKVDKRTASGRELRQSLEAMGEDVAPEVHSRMVVCDAFGAGEWVGQYAPGSLASAEYTALCQHVLGLLKSTPRKEK